MPANLKKRTDLINATTNILDWIGRQPEYLNDYKKWRVEVRREKLLPYEIEKTGHKEKPFKVVIHSSDYGLVKNNVDATEKYTKYLKLKFLRMATPARYTEQEKFRKKWGFYPLFDPKDPFCPTSFFRSIRQRLGGGVFDQAVRPINSSAWPSNRKPAPLPLKVEIDWRQGDRIILHQLKRLLNSHRKVYGLKPNKSRYDRQGIVLKSEILIRAGVSKSEIIRRIVRDMNPLEIAIASKKKIAEQSYSQALKNAKYLL